VFFVTFVCFTHYKLCRGEKKRLHTFILTFLHCEPGWSWTGKVTSEGQLCVMLIFKKNGQEQTKKEKIQWLAMKRNEL